MLFNSVLGCVAQTSRRSEGGGLIAAGLLCPVMDEEYPDMVIGIEPTELLRSYFCGLPPLERLYPLLVAFVAGQRYPEIDDRRAWWKLRAWGISEEGLEALRSI